MKTRAAIGSLLLLAGASWSSIAAADAPPAADAPNAPSAPGPPPGAYPPPYPYPYAPPPPGYAYPPIPYGEPAQPAKGRHWYGWQQLILYGASLPLTILSFTSSSGPVLIGGATIGGTGLFFGGPIVHWAHGKIGRGFAVLGLNVGATVVGGGLGAAILCGAGACSGGDAGPIGLVLGLTVGGASGLLAAQITDVAALSYEDKPAEAGSARRSKGLGFTVLPDVRVTRDRTTLGIVGTF